MIVRKTETEAEATGLVRPTAGQLRRHHAAETGLHVSGDRAPTFNSVGQEFIPVGGLGEALSKQIDERPDLTRNVAARWPDREDRWTGDFVSGEEDFQRARRYGVVHDKRGKDDNTKARDRRFAEYVPIVRVNVTCFGRYIRPDTVD